MEKNSALVSSSQPEGDSPTLWNSGKSSDDTKELVEGWEVGNEYKALKLFDEKVNELKEMIE